MWCAILGLKLLPRVIAVVCVDVLERALSRS
jgi:hypothetical protein